MEPRSFTDNVVVQVGKSRVSVQRLAPDPECTTWTVHCQEGTVRFVDFDLAVEQAGAWVKLLEQARILDERADRVRTRVAAEMRAFPYKDQAQ